jgi:hypothetical protein
MQQKNLKTISGSSPNYDVSNHTTHSQTQTGVAAPLRYKEIADSTALSQKQFGKYFSADIFIQQHPRKKYL